MFEALSRRLRAYAEKDGRGFPDWAVRYVPVARRIRALCPGRARTLEAGANENGLARFLEGPIVVVDIDPAHLAAARTCTRIAPVLADMAALPFADRAFDVVVSMDTIEHIPDTVRPGAVCELMRVSAARGVVAVGFPSGDGALQAEAGVREAYRRYTGGTLSWFEEHRDRVLPYCAGIASCMAVYAGPHRQVHIRKNASLWAWRLMWRILICGWPGRGNALFQALLRAATPLLCRLHAGQCYRTILWAEPDGNT